MYHLNQTVINKNTTNRPAHDLADELVRTNPYSVKNSR